MEQTHRSKLRRKFKGLSHKIKVFNIPDNYDYQDMVLINILNAKLSKTLKEFSGTKQSD
jgi:predicted protein tyrosine phosphatase